MKTKLNAASRLAAAQIKATSQDEAGKLLKILVPLFGPNFKKSTRRVKSWIRMPEEVDYEEILWKHKTYEAGIGLRKGEDLSFWFMAGISDIGFSVKSSKKADAADQVIANAKIQAGKLLKKYGDHVDPELKTLLTKLSNLR